MAALQLAEHGQLDLDRPIQDYLPDFAIRSRLTPQPTFTTRQLMTHHSGLPADYHKDWNSEEPLRYVRQQLKDEYVAYPPNTISSYSNLGSTVLGHVVETLASAPYADWLKTRVLSPMGMEQSYVAARLEPDARLAKPYDEDGKPADSLVIRDIPAGGMVSNVVELGQFIRTVFNHGQTPTGQTLLRPAPCVKKSTEWPCGKTTGGFYISNSMASAARPCNPSPIARRSSPDWDAASRRPSAPKRSTA